MDTIERALLLLGELVVAAGVATAVWWLGTS